jgi:hypothetical protein
MEINKFENTRDIYIPKNHVICWQADGNFYCSIEGSDQILFGHAFSTGDFVCYGADYKFKWLYKPNRSKATVSHVFFRKESIELHQMSGSTIHIDYDGNHISFQEGR